VSRLFLYAAYSVHVYPGSRKVNGVAEVNGSLSRQMMVSNKRSQLHSELVRTTILKDFVDFEGISK